MTIAEAISQCNSMKPNQYENETKIGWLSNLDGIIKNKIIDTHEGGDLIIFTGYDVSTDLETELLVPEPYSDIYVKYLFAQIDFNNGEFTRYNNSMVMYNAAYTEYAQFYNRTVMPLQPNSITV